MEELQRQITELKKEVDQLKNSYSIPRNIETAFKTRLKGLYASSNATGSYTGSNIRRTITVTATPQDISVLEDPAGYIPVEFQGTSYKVPYFND